MPLTTNNLETIINMLTALAQRQEAIRQLATQLHGGTAWRSIDGQLAIILPDSQRAELAGFIKTYLDESEILIASARAILAEGGGP
jgi:DNA-binding transcriptional regulator/RsmH inhibitor MraZ